MEKNQKAKILEAKKAFCSAKNISNNKLAVMTGISTSYLSQMDNGQWENPSEEVWRNLKRSVIDCDNEDIALVKTTNFQKIKSSCEKAKAHKQMIYLEGCAGWGKTTALKQYYEKNSHVYFVKYSGYGAKSLFQSIAKQLGIDYEVRLEELVTSVIEVFQGMKEALLIIDEASDMYKNEGVLRQLRTLRNDTMQNLGIVLAGCEYFEPKMKKALERSKVGIPEFHSRINVWAKLHQPTPVEYEAISKNNGVNFSEISHKKIDNFRDLVNEIVDYKRIQNAQK